MNRTLKRPMFRIGGQVNQGSGIMSHVEPRRVHRANGGRIGFKFGTIPGFQNQAVTPQDESGLDILLRNYGANNLDMQQSGLNSLKGNTTSDVENTSDNLRTTGMQRRFENIKNQKTDFFKNRSELDNFLLKEGIINKDSNPIEIMKAREIYKNKIIEDRTKGLSMEFGNPEGDKVWNADKPIPKKEPEYVETPKTDPREAIKKDRDFLKSILEGEDYQDMSRGEAALVIARALAEPGPIANKIKVANELAIPIIRSKRKEDRELTLEAYKTYREKELEDIKSGKATDLEKQVRAMTDAYMRANKEDKRGRDVIYNEMFEKRLGEEKSLDKSRLVGFTGIQQQLESKVNAVRKAEADKAIGKKIDEEVLKENKAFIESVKSRYPDFYKANFPELRANGGRIGYAEGTLEPTENNQIESTPTPEDAGTQQSQLKPVVKLSFQELRSRLPKEITNDIVGLISNSEQALQDFAYIKTQQDVNNFNIKYGVNLVLPSNR
jgi:hypothetical protein